MGKAHGKSRRMRRKFNYGKDRKKAWKKSKQLPHIKCEVIKDNWEASKGVHQNMALMGLSSDPNRSLRIPGVMELMKQSFANHESEMSEPTESKKKNKQKGAEKEFVIKALEKEAARPMNSNFHVSNDIALFAKYMRDKYDENYEEMARDPRNYYQLTPNQIKKRIAEYDTSRYISALKMVNKEDAGD